MRPKDWIKNIFVLHPLIYSKLLTNIDKATTCFKGFIIFSIISGCIYIINDISDIKKDRVHPINKKRPLASGVINTKQLILFLILVLPCTLFFSFNLNKLFGIIISIYLVINILYSIKFKDIVIIDIMIIAAGFVLRVLGGGILVSINPSPWVVISTFFLALFLSCAKRRCEILLSLNSSINLVNQRETLKKYSVELLDAFLAILATCAILSYSIYTASDYVFIKFHSYNLIYTNGFVIFGFFRYYYLLLVKKIIYTPTEVIFVDIPIIINLILWILTTIFIIGL